jgi:peptide deformylase
LKKQAAEIDPDYKDLKILIENMWETMYASSGVGPAAPQVGVSIRLFIIDAGKYDEKFEGIQKVIINPEILKSSNEIIAYEEGCLSIPHIRENVSRPESITLGWEDENFEYHEETFDDVVARIIQHELDHLNGVLFTDRIAALRKRLIRKRLEQISKGQVKTDYKMVFPGGKSRIRAR